MGIYPAAFSSSPMPYCHLFRLVVSGSWLAIIAGVQRCGDLDRDRIAAGWHYIGIGKR
jgi:hypothetical protein